MITRFLDRLDALMAAAGDERRWFAIGLAIPAAVLALLAAGVI